MDVATDVVRVRLTGDESARRTMTSRLRRRAALVVTHNDDTLFVDVPLAGIERTGPSIEARAIDAGLDLWIDALDAVVPRYDLDGYGSRIWAALGDAHIRNLLAVDRGEEPSTDPFAFVRVEERDGVRIVINARVSWDPDSREPLLGPAYWDDVPGPEEIERAIGSGGGIVVVELQPDRPPTINRLESVHEDPDLEARLPSPPEGRWSEVTSHRDTSVRRLRRGLRELGVDPKRTSEAFAIAGTGPDVVTARLNRVPGACAEDLEQVFSTTVLGFKAAPWHRERIAGVDVLVARERFGVVDDFGVMTAEDGLIAVLGGPRRAVEEMLRALVRRRSAAPLG